MYNLPRGADWTLDFGSATWDDGTNISEAELATATCAATIAGLTATVTADPVPGVRLRLEVASTLTAAILPRQYGGGVKITISGKVQVHAFEVFVEPGLPTPRVPCP